MISVEASHSEHAMMSPETIEAPSLGGLRVAHFEAIGTSPFVGPLPSISPRSVYGAVRHLERFMRQAGKAFVVLPTNRGEQTIEIYTSAPPNIQPDGLCSWPEWRATFKVRYHADHLTAHEVAELLGYVGALVGIGADCPALGGGNGTFDILAGTEYEM